MARIRNVKPDFFMHDDLHDLEERSGLRMALRLAYVGLWTQSDRRGVFPWRPKRLKAVIFPWDDLDMSEVLDALEAGGFIVRFTCPDGDKFGHIPTFGRHQAISGKEAQSPARYPCPPKGEIPQNEGEVPGKSPGSPREVGETTDIGHRTKDKGLGTGEGAPPPGTSPTRYGSPSLDEWADAVAEIRGETPPLVLSPRQMGTAADLEAAVPDPDKRRRLMRTALNDSWFQDRSGGFPLFVSTLEQWANPDNAPARSESVRAFLAIGRDES